MLPVVSQRKVMFHNDIRFFDSISQANPIALRKAKIVYNFGLSECNRVKLSKNFDTFQLQVALHLLVYQRYSTQNGENSIVLF